MWLSKGEVVREMETACYILAVLCVIVLQEPTYTVARNYVAPGVIG